MSDEDDVVFFIEPVCSDDVFLQNRTEHSNINYKRTYRQSVSHIDLQCHEPCLSDHDDDISVKRRRTSLYSQSSDSQKNYFTQISNISNNVNRRSITNHNPMIEKVQQHGYIVANYICYIPLRISKCYTPFNIVDIYDNIEKIYDDSFFIVDSIDIYHVLCSWAYF
jgi:hypothetical protein